jgi:hypothetical protein
MPEKTLLNLASLNITHKRAIHYPYLSNSTNKKAALSDSIP